MVVSDWNRPRGNLPLLADPGDRPLLPELIGLELS
jgi:hypothetical protein